MASIKDSQKVAPEIKNDFISMENYLCRLKNEFSKQIIDDDPEQILRLKKRKDFDNVSNIVKVKEDSQLKKEEFTEAGEHLEKSESYKYTTNIPKREEKTSISKAFNRSDSKTILEGGTRILGSVGKNNVDIKVIIEDYIRLYNVASKAPKSAAVGNLKQEKSIAKDLVILSALAIIWKKYLAHHVAVASPIGNGLDQQGLEENTESENTESEEEEPKAEEPKAKESKAEKPKAEEPKAEEPKDEELKTGEPKAEERKPEESKDEEPKPEEQKSDKASTEATPPPPPPPPPAPVPNVGNEEISGVLSKIGWELVTKQVKVDGVTIKSGQLPLLSIQYSSNQLFMFDLSSINRDIGSKVTYEDTRAFLVKNSEGDYYFVSRNEMNKWATRIRNKKDQLGEPLYIGGKLSKFEKPILPNEQGEMQNFVMKLDKDLSAAVYEGLKLKGEGFRCLKNNEWIYLLLMNSSAPNSSNESSSQNKMAGVPIMASPDDIKAARSNMGKNKSTVNTQYQVFWDEFSNELSNKPIINFVENVLIKNTKYPIIIENIWNHSRNSIKAGVKGLPQNFDEPKFSIEKLKTPPVKYWACNTLRYGLANGLKDITTYSANFSFIATAPAQPAETLRTTLQNLGLDVKNPDVRSTLGLLKDEDEFKQLARTTWTYIKSE